MRSRQRCVGLGEQRRRAADEQAHVRGRLARQAGMVEQAGVEGRHAHQRSRARQRRDHRVGVEARLEDHRRAGEQRDIGGDEQAMGMEDGQRVDQHVVGGEAPELDERLGVGGEIVVGEHRALRAPGRARGVEDGGEIVARARTVGNSPRVAAIRSAKLPSRCVAEAFDRGSPSLAASARTSRRAIAGRQSVSAGPRRRENIRARRAYRRC